MHFDVRSIRALQLVGFVALGSLYSALAIPAAAQPPEARGQGTEGRDWVRGPRRAKISAAKYQILTEEDVPVRMRDGTILRVNVHRPQARGRFPCVLDQPGYGKTVYSQVDSEIAAHGYASVVADIRGTGNSEGEMHLYSATMQRDGYDLVEWMARQPWCNGRVGLHGVSWGAINSYLTAKQRPPHLKAMIPIQGAGDLYRGLWYVGGMSPGSARIMWDLTANGVGLGGGPLVPPTCGPDCVPAYADHLAQPSKSFYVDARQHPTYDKWWRERSTIASDHEAMARHGIAVLFQDGWKDYFVWATTHAFAEFNRAADRLASPSRPKRSRKSMLIVGPWMHNGEEGVVPYTFPEYRVLWWDRWLKGVRNGVDRQDSRVLLYVQGPNEWRFERDWPVPDAKKARLYLRAEPAGAGNSRNDGSLTAKRPLPGETSVQYDYVPANNSGSSGNTTIGVEVPAHDQRVEEVPGLTWTSAPLRANTEVTGPVRFVFYASATAEDTDFVAELTDVASDGSSSSVTQGWLRASHRISSVKPTRLHPGRVYRFEVDVYPTSYVFQAGHRIRIALNGSDIPLRAPSTTPATITVYQDAKHQSSLELPIIGTSELLSETGRPASAATRSEGQDAQSSATALPIIGSIAALAAIAPRLPPRRNRFRASLHRLVHNADEPGEHP